MHVLQSSGTVFTDLYKAVCIVWYLVHITKWKDTIQRPIKAVCIERYANNSLRVQFTANPLLKFWMLHSWYSVLHSLEQKPSYIRYLDRVRHLDSYFPDGFGDLVLIPQPLLDAVYGCRWQIWCYTCLLAGGKSGNRQLCITMQVCGSCSLVSNPDKGPLIPLTCTSTKSVISQPHGFVGLTQHPLAHLLPSSSHW